MKARMLAAAALFAFALASVGLDRAARAASRAPLTADPGPRRSAAPSFIATASPATTRACKAGGLLLDQLDVAHPDREPQIVGEGRAEAAHRHDAAGRRAASGPRHARSPCARPSKPRSIAPPPRRRTRARRCSIGSTAPNTPTPFAICSICPIDAAALLPGDDSSDGFDNIANVLSVSPALMQAYVSAAAKISRLAVGDPTITSGHRHLSGAAGSVAGRARARVCRSARAAASSSQHVFPLDAEYEFRVDADRRGGFGLPAVGAEEPVEITIERRAAADCSDATRHAVIRAPRSARVRSRSASPSSARRTRAASTICSRSWRISCRRAEPVDHRSAQPDRARRHAEPPQDLRLPARDAAEDEAPCARRILAALATRALPPAGSGTRSVDRHPDGLLRVRARASRLRHRHSVRAGARPRRSADSSSASSASRPSLPAGAVYRINDFELASRLSFFLWSSIPDEELLARGEGRHADDAGGARAADAADAGRSARGRARRQLRRPVAPAAAARRRSRRARRSSTATCATRSGARPSCCSKPSSARTAASSTCSTPTTRSWTSGSRGTTAFRTSAAAASGASTLDGDARGAACSARAAS